MSSAHPSFANPTVVEALAEIEVRVDPSKWSIARPAKLIAALEADFPGFDVDRPLGIEVSLGEAGQAQRVRPGPMRLKFLSADKKRMVQTQETVFTFNFLEPYPGWGVVKPAIVSSWKIVAGIVAPLQIVRIGVRYINRFPRSASTAAVGAWLQAGRFVPEAAVDSAGHLLMRLETQLGDSHMMNVSIGSDMAAAPPYRPLMFDLDAVFVGAMPPSEANVGDKIEFLHDQVWAAFSTSIGPALKQHLEKTSA